MVFCITGDSHLNPLLMGPLIYSVAGDYVITFVPTLADSTGFRRATEALGLPHTPLSPCSWECITYQEAGREVEAFLITRIWWLCGTWRHGSSRLTPTLSCGNSSAEASLPPCGTALSLWLAALTLSYQLVSFGSHPLSPQDCRHKPQR